MKRKELRERLNSLFKEQKFIEARELCSSLEVYFWNGENYTNNPAAAQYDKLGSCTNSYLKCEDGFFVNPF